MVGPLSFAIFELRRLDNLASLDSRVHRLDPRAKLLATLGCIVVVLSFPKYEIAALVPFLAFPLFLAALSGISYSYITGKVLLVLPLVAMLSLANPFLDHYTMLKVSNNITISAGWVSFCSILLRCTITVATAFILVATTGMNNICLAMERLKVSRIFVSQLLLLYRYLFVLLDESSRLQRARQLRVSNRCKFSIKVAGQLICQLLLRSIDRAQRIYWAMCCRGFDGEFRRCTPLRFNSADVYFLVGCLVAFGFLRMVNLPYWLGCILENLFV